MDISRWAALAVLAAPSQQARLVQLQPPAPGLVVERFEGQEAVCGLARYRLTLAPWTSLLELRRNAVIFQDLDTRTICEQIFSDYPQAVFRFDIQGTLPARAITTQYRETDCGVGE